MLTHIPTAHTEGGRGLYFRRRGRGGRKGWRPTWNPVITAISVLKPATTKASGKAGQPLKQPPLRGRIRWDRRREEQRGAQDLSNFFGNDASGDLRKVRGTRCRLSLDKETNRGHLTRREGGATTKDLVSSNLLVKQESFRDAHGLGPM